MTMSCNVVVRQLKVPSGMVWHGTVWYGMVRYEKALQCKRYNMGRHVGSS